MKRPPRIGWVREVSILLPLVTLLLVLVSTVTLLAYRSAVEELRLALPEVAADPSGELAYQAVLVGRLSWLVISVNVALTLLVLLYLRHLVTPVETLLRQARGLAANREDVAGDEIEFLVSTFERAITALARGDDEEPDEREIASLRRALSSSLDSGVLLVDSNHRVLAVNAIGAELLGLPPDPPDAPTISEYAAQHPELVEIVTAANLAGEGVSRRELEIRHAGGEVATLGLTAHPLRRDDGTTRGVLVLFVDLTEARSRADEEQRASSLAQLGRMSAGLAHEMRNSLAALRGYLTLIERHPDEESITDYLGEIRGESDQLHRVVEDFLSFARPEARLETVSLDELARHVAADPGLGGKEVLVRDTMESPVRIRADRQLLERALRNLLLNAAQADGESGSSAPLEMTLRRDEKALTIVIADRGPGLPAERARELFEPFATTRADGVGLGLPMAQRILELHGGTLRLEARDGGGTAAVATLPAGIIVT